MGQDTLVKVENLKKEFPTKKSFFGKTIESVKAVNDLSFEIKRGECLALVGESGCGKSTTARLILKLIEADDGKVTFFNNGSGDGKSVLELGSNEMREMRTNMQMIFQNPFSSLDPRFKIFDTIAEPLVVHKWSKDRIKAKVFELLSLVDLDEDLAYRFPHQLSGGQRQRVGIARALALNPQFIIADEAVSALDVSVQAQVLDLIKDLRKDLNLTFLFIAHNLGVVREIADRVAVMYLGEIVELAETKEIFTNPKHPYTKALFSSAPIADPSQRDRERIFLKGEIPSPSDIPSGCPFHTRCPIAESKCSSTKPNLQEIKDDHFASCLLSANYDLSKI